VVERCFKRFKQFRAVATRFEKWAVNHRAMVVIASLVNLAWNGCRTGTGQHQPGTVVCAGLKLGRDRVDIPSDSSFA
jgi:hypothetical protein